MIAAVERVSPTFKRACVTVLGAGVLAGCGSAPSAQPLGGLCERYASAAVATLPPSLPSPVPRNFAAGLKASATHDCEQLAVRLGYASAPSDLGRATVTRSQATRLIGTLTAHTPVRVPGVPVPDKYQVGIPLSTAQAAGPSAPTTPSGLARPPRRYMSYLARAVGSLPLTGKPTVAGVRLPKGHRAGHGLPEWETDAAPPDAVTLAARLADVFPETGLWPVLWSVPDEPTSYMDGGGMVNQIARTNVASLLRGAWDAFGNLNRSRGAGPYSEPFPGMAPSTEHDRKTANPFLILNAQLPQLQSSDGGPYRLLLIPCRRPADAITAVGLALSNDYNDAQISAVLRSWEDRFGARVILLGTGYFMLAVDRPPRTHPDARQLAAEIFALAPPGDALARRLDDLASSLLGHGRLGDLDFDPASYSPATWLIGFDN